jgi:DNA-binding HxlR family transcriptional regulator
MANVFVRMSKTNRIIELCEEPQRFSDLKRGVGISDAGLTKHLKTLQKLGWIQKMQNGKYSLTESGRHVLPSAQRAASVLVNYKTTVKTRNVVIHHYGLEGKDGEKLVNRIGDTAREYLDNHPAKSFSVMLLYKSKAEKTVGSE